MNKRDLDLLKKNLSPTDNFYVAFNNQHDGSPSYWVNSIGFIVLSTDPQLIPSNFGFNTKSISRNIEGLETFLSTIYSTGIKGVSINCEYFTVDVPLFLTTCGHTISAIDYCIDVIGK